jgi:flagellar basal-body rod modification protein FlgD
MANAADKVTATVKDANGNVIRAIELGSQGAGQHTFGFDGKNAGGTALPDGRYTLEIDASVPGQKTGTSLSLSTLATVDGVDMSADPPAVLVGDQHISIDQVQVVHGSGS